MNGCQQGFSSVASFGFSGQESALKPPQSISKPLGIIFFFMRFLILLIFISACSRNVKYDGKIHLWDKDIIDFESIPLIDTSYNFSSQHNLKTLYVTECIFDNYFNEIINKKQLVSDTLEIELRNKGLIKINDNTESVYKILTLNKPNAPFYLQYIYSQKYGLILYTHSHTSYVFYHQKCYFLKHKNIVDSIIYNYDKIDVFNFFFSDINIQELDPHAEPEIPDSVYIDIDLDD